MQESCMVNDWWLSHASADTPILQIAGLYSDDGSHHAAMKRQAAWEEKKRQKVEAKRMAAANKSGWTTSLKRAFTHNDKKKRFPNSTSSSSVKTVASGWTTGSDSTRTATPPPPVPSKPIFHSTPMSRTSPRINMEDKLSQLETEFETVVISASSPTIHQRQNSGHDQAHSSGLIPSLPTPPRTPQRGNDDQSAIRRADSYYHFIQATEPCASPANSAHKTTAKISEPMVNRASSLILPVDQLDPLPTTSEPNDEDEGTLGTPGMERPCSCYLLELGDLGALSLFPLPPTDLPGQSNVQDTDNDTNADLGDQKRHASTTGLKPLSTHFQLSRHQHQHQHQPDRARVLRRREHTHDLSPRGYATSSPPKIPLPPTPPPLTPPPLRAMRLPSGSSGETNASWAIRTPITPNSPLLYPVVPVDAVDADGQVVEFYFGFETDPFAGMSPSAHYPCARPSKRRLHHKSSFTMGFKDSNGYSIAQSREDSIKRLERSADELERTAERLRKMRDCWV